MRRDLLVEKELREKKRQRLKEEHENKKKLVC